MSLKKKATQPYGVTMFLSSKRTWFQPFGVKKTALGFTCLILTCLLPTLRGFQSVLKQGRGKKHLPMRKPKLTT